MEILDLGAGKIGVAAASTDVFSAEAPDAVLVPQTLAREVNLEGEIEGLTAFSALYAAASLECTYPVLCGCRTRVGEVARVSVFTFMNGRLIDIADRTLSPVLGGEQEGDKIKVFSRGKFRLGLLVDTDILFASNWKKLVPHVDAVAGIALAPVEHAFEYLSALSARYGMPFAATFLDGSLLWGKP